MFGAEVAVCFLLKNPNSSLYWMVRNPWVRYFLPLETSFGSLNDSYRQSLWEVSDSSDDMDTS